MIALRHITKTLGKYKAVTELTLTVDSGRTLGFVGANGAGKTTTIRLMMGFLRPTVGTIHLMGHNMNRPHEARLARARLGFVPDSGGLDPLLSGQQLLNDLAAIQTAPPVDRAKISDALQLAPRDLQRPIGRLSRGTRQKINLVQGLQHRPDLLVLDEPTEGLDPFAKRALFDILQQAKARGATIFFSSHVLSELEGICDKVALIRQGKIIQTFSLDKNETQPAHRVCVQLQREATPTSSSLGLVQTLVHQPSVTALDHANDAISFHASDLAALLPLLAAHPVAELTIAPLSLEDRIMPHYVFPEKPPENPAPNLMGKVHSPSPSVEARQNLHGERHSTN